MKTKIYKLDTGNDGCDEILTGESVEEVTKDVCSYHELDELHEEWELVDLSPQIIDIIQKNVEYAGSHFALMDDLRMTENQADTAWQEYKYVLDDNKLY